MGWLYEMLHLWHYRVWEVTYPCDDIKQTNEKRIELYGGFDKDEMSQWWIKNDSKSPLMNDKQKEKIEYITRRNPLFLSFFLGSKENLKMHSNYLKKCQ
ncbi:unnamed protein product [Rhizophagus irregularis]|nr:unnamed protein product [Rhizophagus irregularis]